MQNSNCLNGRAFVSTLRTHREVWHTEHWTARIPCASSGRHAAHGSVGDTGATSSNRDLIRAAGVLNRLGPDLRATNTVFVQEANGVASPACMELEWAQHHIQD